MSRARADQHSHVPDPAGEAQLENLTFQCDFYSRARLSAGFCQ